MQRCAGVMHNTHYTHTIHTSRLCEGAHRTQLRCSLFCVAHLIIMLNSPLCVLTCQCTHLIIMLRSSVSVLTSLICLYVCSPVCVLTSSLCSDPQYVCSPHYYAFLFAHLSVYSPHHYAQIICTCAHIIIVPFCLLTCLCTHLIVVNCYAQIICTCAHLIIMPLCVLTCLYTTSSFCAIKSVRVLTWAGPRKESAVGMTLGDAEAGMRGGRCRLASALPFALVLASSPSASDSCFRSYM